MTIEEELKSYILTRYKSIREFTISIDIPYTTLDTIFKRGVQNSSISNIIKICNGLHISADALANGEIVPVYKPKNNNEEYYKISQLDLSTEELDELYRYGEFLKSKRG